MKNISFTTLLLSSFIWIGCATGEDKNEGTTEEPNSSVGTSFERDQTRSTGTTAPGDTAGVNTTPTGNDQVGPTGNGGQGGSQ